jgi:hypothetical protein
MYAPAIYCQPLQLPHPDGEKKKLKERKKGIQYQEISFF